MTDIVSNASSFQHPFENPDLPREERIADLLSLMTIATDAVETTGPPH